MNQRKHPGFRKPLVLLLALALSLTLLSTGALAATGTGFSDVPANAWFASAVVYCRDAGLMGGVGGGKFGPNTTMSRAMLVTVLYRMSGSPSASGDAIFSDVSPKSWYGPAVAWASENNVVSGYGNGVFRPNDPITREQMASILWRYAGSPEVEDAQTFADEESIAGYARPAVNWARSMGIIGGVGNNSFAPRNTATRAQAATVLMNYSRYRGMAELSGMDVMCQPNGVAAMPDSSLLVTDLYGKVIWRVENGTSTVYAGADTVEDLSGEPVGGYNDAPQRQSFFKEPWAVAPYRGGWAVSDAGNGAIRLVLAGKTQTVSGATVEELTVTEMGVTFNRPTGLASDEAGNLYVAETLENAIRKIAPNGMVTTYADGLNDPTGLCWKNGVLYVAETGANRIVKIENGSVSLVAGSGADGLTDGPAAQAAFSNPQGVAVGDDGTVYVADTVNAAIRCVKNGTVTTLAARDPADPDTFAMTSPTGLLLRGKVLYICDNFARKLLLMPLE